MAPRNKREVDIVSASALAQMGICERRIVFAQQRGQCVSEEQDLARRRGMHAHRCFYLEGSLSKIGGSRWRNAAPLGCLEWLARLLRPLCQLAAKLRGRGQRPDTGQGKHGSK